MVGLGWLRNAVEHKPRSKQWTAVLYGFCFKFLRLSLTSLKDDSSLQDKKISSLQAAFGQYLSQQQRSKLNQYKLEQPKYDELQIPDRQSWFYTANSMVAWDKYQDPGLTK